MSFGKTFSSKRRNSFSNNLNTAQVLSHFNFSDLDNFIRSHGVSANIKKAILCPCIKSDTGQPSINCGVCRTSGFAYIGEVDSGNSCAEKPVKIIMGGRQDQKSYNQVGGYSQSGQTSAVLFNYMPASGDLVKPNVDIEVINDEFHKKGHLYSNGKTSEFLFMEQVLKVEGIYKINSDKSDIITYKLDVDFNIVGRKIEWIVGGESPSLGELYNVRYQAIPEYIVMGASPTFFVEHDDDEPQRVREDIDKPIVYDVQLTRLDKVLSGRHHEQSP